MALSRRLAAGLLCLLSLFVYLPQSGAQTQTPQRPIRAVVEQWERTFNAITLEIDRGQISPERALELKARLIEIEKEAVKVRTNAETALKPVKVQLEALGPAPAEGEPAETQEIADQRNKIVDDIAAYEARTKQADLAATKVKDLGLQINAMTLERTIQRLLQSYPIPIVPGTIAVAVPEFFEALAVRTKAPAAWWRSLSEDQRQSVLTRVATYLIPAIVFAWLLRRALLRFFGRDRAIQHPTYARRLTGAVAEGLAHGIVPSFIMAAVLLRARSEATLMSGLLAEMVVAGCGVAIMIVLAWALPRAVLAPDLPAWRMLPFPADHARIIGRRIVYLAAVFAADNFLAASSQDIVPTDELRSLYLFVFGTMEATGILLLTQGWLWRWEEAELAAAPATDEAPPKTGNWGFWTSLKRIIGLFALAAVAAATFGYVNLSRYVIENLVVSGMAIGILFLLRGVIREAIGAALRSRVMQDTLAIPHKSRNRYKFWLRAALNVAIQLGGLVLLMIVWGVPADDIYAWARGVLQGFTIGSVTISLSEIFIAVLIFIAAMVSTRAIQRALTERVFPQTNLDVGIQNSLSSGLGYLGLAIAAMLAISAIGLDLSNVALIAGALSVGIGFGLQAIINNFVSGLILLIERPIKVGDWIVVGAYEGTVKRINVRATEIETFQRASIIVPNSELISGAVTNWTHKDSYGRVEIPIGVAYGSDVQQAMAILRKCLDDHPEILAWPEPNVLFRRFGESSLDFEARGFIANVTLRIIVISQLCVAIDQAFREAEIEIPFPQRDLHIRSAEGLSMEARQRAAADGTAPPSPAAPGKDGGDRTGSTTGPDD